jgi:hypothetical protein
MSRAQQNDDIEVLIKVRGPDPPFPTVLGVGRELKIYSLHSMLQAETKDKAPSSTTTDLQLG